MDNPETLITKRWVTWTPPKIGGEPRCSRRVCSAYFL